MSRAPARTAGDDLRAIEDIASLRFRGIQLRSNVIQEFGTAAAVRDLLDKHKLALVALSSGSVRIDLGVEAEEIARHTAHAKFVQDAGGLYLQVTAERPNNRSMPSAYH